MHKRLSAAAARHHEFRLALIVAVVAIFFATASPGFRTFGNLRDLLESQSVLAIMASGLLVVLVAGGIDVSFAAVAAVTQYVVATWIMHATANWVMALVLAMAVGAAIGAVNAGLVHGLKAPPVIVTIATMTFYFSMLMWVTGGVPLYDLPDWFTAKSAGWWGLPLPVLVAAAALAGTGFLLQRLTLGRQLFALGGNAEAARRVGCRIGRLQCFAYGFSGAMAGVAGLVQAHRVEEVAPNALIGRELDVLAAVVLGGASLTGGAGTVSGTVLGIALLAILRNGLTLMGASSYWFGVLTGMVILASVSGAAWAQRASGRKGGQRASG